MSVFAAVVLFFPQIRKESVVCSQTYFWSETAKAGQKLKGYALVNEYVLNRDSVPFILT